MFKKFLVVVLAFICTTLSVSAGSIKSLETAGNNIYYYTENEIWVSSDSGADWRDVSPTTVGTQKISAISFPDPTNGFAVLSNADGYFSLAQTTDSGASWQTQTLSVPSAIASEAGEAILEFTDARKGSLILRLTASSNFTRAAIFDTDDGGINWTLRENLMERGEINLPERIKKTSAGSVISRDTVKSNGQTIKLGTKLSADEAVSEIRSLANGAKAILIQGGKCADLKRNCVQTSRLMLTLDGKDFRPINTPDMSKKASETLEKIFSSDFTAAKNDDSPAFQTTNAANRITFGNGFDKCTAAPASQMQTWWLTSPFRDVNIYVGGNNRGCTQAQLTATWVSQVSAMGWGLIPTWVGPQAPQGCTTCTRCASHSSDPTTAETEGRAQADLATTAVTNLGLPVGSVIYYDMERYNDTGCGTPVTAFLKGWTDRIKELGYVSGTYGSPFNANIDWVNIPAASRMDAVWLARWNNLATVWDVAPLPNTFWKNHQRIHQYIGDHNETWGGITFNIDSNFSDAPVIGNEPRRTKGDFDGDGKADVAVFRPSDGNWFTMASSNSSVGAVSFGISTDTPVAGDFDGNGQTDYGVFRPETGVWHALISSFGRSSATYYRARQFGTNTDMPLVADFDGDGRSDLAVYRGGNWYMTFSVDGRDINFRGESFGLPEDKPVPADYDGDGKADIAVFRPSNGTWYVLGSQSGFFGIQWGASTDKPVVGDFDGDGKSDFGVYRPSQGTWFILQSSAGVKVFQLGSPEDKPVPADYDGDGKADIAVFRPSNGTWYQQKTTEGFSAIQFGLSSDVPIF